MPNKACEKCPFSDFQRRIWKSRKTRAARNREVHLCVERKAAVLKEIARGVNLNRVDYPSVFDDLMGLRIFREGPSC